MLRISPGTRRRLVSDPFMERCAKCGRRGVQWHHVMFWDRQLDEWWAIVPACPLCHRQVDTNERIDGDGNTARQLFQWVALLRMPESAKARHSRWDWGRLRQLLNVKFKENYWYIAKRLV